MARYKGNTVAIARPIETVYDRVSDLSGYQQYVDRLPDDIKAKIGDVVFEPDAIYIGTPIGKVALKMTEKNRPADVKFEAQGSPVPLSVKLQLEEPEAEKTLLTPVVEVEVPGMMLPFVGPKMQSAADQLSTLIGNLFGGALS